VFLFFFFDDLARVNTCLFSSSVLQTIRSLVKFVLSLCLMLTVTGKLKV